MPTISYLMHKEGFQTTMIKFILLLCTSVRQDKEMKLQLLDTCKYCKYLLCKKKCFMLLALQK